MARFTTEQMREAKATKGPETHLYRGAPFVRTWSQHQEIIEDWTLCGIHRASEYKNSAVTTDPEEVTCEYCHQLMHSGPINKARREALCS